MEDVDFGYVHDFGTGEEFVATRDQGATLNGEVLDTEAGGEALEVVGFESARPEWLAPVLEELDRRASGACASSARSRSRCAGSRPRRFDGMVTPTCAAPSTPRPAS